MSEKRLNTLIKGCRKNDRHSQRELYKMFYNYGMTVCIRYASNREEAKEILNDAFVKVFTKLDKYSTDLSFKGWFNRILVNTAIDHFRKKQSDPKTVDIIHAQHYQASTDIYGQLAVEEVFEMVKLLPPAYRMVFNLYIVEGLKHKEIADKLGISVGASKSNLAKARMKLKTMIVENEKIRKYAG